MNKIQIHAIFSIVLFGLIQSVPVESAITCPEVKPLQHGDMVATQKPPYAIGTNLTFSCDIGFKGKGRGAITCLPDGRWSGPVPYCQAFLCERDLTKIKEEIGRRCRKSCNSDIDCKGDFKRCLCDDWCGKSCYNPEASCRALKSPTNGYIVGSDFSFGYTVTYGCNEGYILRGSKTRRCRADRKWSGYEAQCVGFGTCGQPGDVEKTLFSGKVIAGTDSKVGAWPWQALLFHNNENNFDQIYNRESGFAGGSVINDKWILSASHVFYDSFPLIFRNKNWNENFLIALGMTVYPDRGTVVPHHVAIYEPAEVIPHPDYDSDSFDYDVALVRIGNRLKRDSGEFVIDSTFEPGVITFTQYIRPVCLPCMNNKHEGVDIWNNFNQKACNPQGRSLFESVVKVGTHVIVTGFGRKKNPDELFHFLPKKLQEGILRIVDDKSCADGVKKIQSEVDTARYTDRMLCARSLNDTIRVDSCQGDSGGPLVQQVIESDRVSYWTQIGIVSWGWGCGNEYPGYYTSVMSVMSWIWGVLDKKRIDSWNNWGPWSACSNVFNGHQYRLRTCKGKNCEGSDREAKFCSVPRAGMWATWSSWSPCSNLCAEGLQTRMRVCLGARNCVGEDKQTKTCILPPCPRAKTCPKVYPPLHGSIEVRPLPSSTSVGTVVTFLCPEGKFLKNGPNSISCMENGAWSDSKRPICMDEWTSWSSWSACTATCSGVRYKARKCNKGGGLLNSILGCKGDSAVYMKCNTDKCDTVGDECQGGSALCVKDNLNVESTDTLVNELTNLLNIWGRR